MTAGLPRRRPVVWLLLSVLAALSTGGLWFIGVSTQSFDLGDECDQAHQPVDDAYRSAHWQEPGRWFPLHDKCNAGFDLVPAWINPTLVVLTVITAICVVVTVATAVASVRRNVEGRRTTPV